jgi:hypothetical protein
MYVNPLEHRYLEDPAHREEGGTPSIVGAIRAGLVFQLKDAVGADAIRHREEDLIGRAIEAWSGNPNIEILGNTVADRLSIVSFVVRHGSRRYLHHNFIVALLNDLFGIQSRGGCSCAGPYGHRLLGIDLETSHEFEREIARGCEGIKPGWVRVNFNYFISDTVFRFILDAVDFVASHGHELLSDYTFDPPTGLWRNVRGVPEPPMSLHEIGYAAGGMTHVDRRHIQPEDRLAEYFDEATVIVEKARGVEGTRPTWEPTEDFEHLRWFPLPHEVAGAAAQGP